MTVIPTSRFFEPEFATAYAQFDTKQANQWLDEMGLIDTDGDGFRQYSNGEPLVITLEYINFETPKQISLELVTSYWREVGLDFRLKEVDAALQAGRAMAGLMQMTAWHADRSTDILFPFQPQWHVPMHIGWEESHWNDWSIWHLSEGARGEEPPPAIKQLQTWWVEMFQSTDHARVTELGKLILENNRFIDKIRFVSSGTEAVMSAIRLARGVTGKNKVIKFEGCYHGHVDSLLVRAGSGLATFGESTSAGIPDSFIKETLVLFQ